jgi:hypothetical protein
MSLAEYLETVSERRWRWGETDCLMMLADWVRLRTGLDPAVNIRGTYSTEEESLALMRRHRGIVGCIDHCVGPLGISRTVSPSRGDIGVVFAWIRRRGQAKLRLTGAICIGPKLWAVKSPTGLMAADFKCLQAWKTTAARGLSCG